MSGSKTNKLRGQWLDTKIEMLAWIQKTIAMMECGSSAKDVESMVNAAGKLIKMLGDIAPDEQEAGLDEKDLDKASERVRRAIKNFGNSTIDIFGDNEEDEDDE